MGLLRTNPGIGAFVRRLRVEMATSVLLGLASGLLVGLSALMFSEGAERRLIIIALLVSIMAAMLAAALIGSFVPRLVRAFGADPKFASGPVTLMAVDIASTLAYLTVATAVFASHLASISSS